MSEAYNIYVVKHHVKTHNLTDTLAQIEREGISYAEWQKRQFAPYYDVRSTIKLDISIMREQSFQREYERIIKKDKTEIFEKYDMKTPETVRVFKERRCKHEML